MFDHGIACILEGPAITERNLIQASVSGRISSEELPV
jgi:hypothetical protein